MPTASRKKSLSIVIPCYNEEDGIPYLAQKLNQAVAELQQCYDLELIFVDDGSADKTNQVLQHYYGKNSENIKATIVKHEHNRNVGAALRTGFSHASSDLIAVLDSDCTYDPALLISMLAMLDEKTDIVTVSPYHPQGKIHNVPGYRIFLSKSASLLYRILLQWHLHTYTAMVRVYKKEVLQNISFERDNFLGVTELLVNAILKGYTVQELPAELHARKFGVSKMKMLPFRVIKDHLSLMKSIIKHKVFGNTSIKHKAFGNSL